MSFSYWGQYFNLRGWGEGKVNDIRQFYKQKRWQRIVRWHLMKLLVRAGLGITNTYWDRRAHMDLLTITCANSKKYSQIITFDFNLISKRLSIMAIYAFFFLELYKIVILKTTFLS